MAALSAWLTQAPARTYLPLCYRKSSTGLGGCQRRNQPRDSRCQGDAADIKTGKYSVTSGTESWRAIDLPCISIDDWMKCNLLLRGVMAIGSTSNKVFSFKIWWAALLFGAGLLLFAACNVEDPSNNGSENDGSTTPSDVQSPAPETDDPTFTPLPGDIPDPGETPGVSERTNTSSIEPSDGTPEAAITRRPIPNGGGDSTTQRTGQAGI